ncbi:unnamed protein product [Staurois parvus]|uniref:Uncharacterized protein n=1 Tax=Staurois parvus TaxID=386267 RepID=A0ABN9F414_9NEOB|nr:unnamed protein product [Staurois parvus]
MALMGDTERQLRWALISGNDVYWQVALMGTERQHSYIALIGGTDWHC